MNIQEQIKNKLIERKGKTISSNEQFNQELEETLKSLSKSILEGLVEREKAENNGYTAPDCNDPFLVEQGFSIAKQNTISHLEYLIKSLE